MANFSGRSTARLLECHEDLQLLFFQVVKNFDCSIMCGHRGEEAQNEAFDKGYSKLKFPQSKHNKTPSMAVDVIPYPIDWDDTNRMYFFGGYVKGIAEGLEVKIRWGGDWDRDTEIDDQSFIDLPHFELI
jgi:hypothetical protein